MTGITWEQAREEVLERWPKSYGSYWREDRFVITDGPIGFGAVVVGEGEDEHLAYLNAYARMTETTVVPPSFADQMQYAIDHGNVSARMEALQAQLAAANEQYARLDAFLEATR